MDTLTVEEAAEILRMTPNQLRNLRWRNRGPISYRKGKRIYYLRSDVEAWEVRDRESSKRGGV